MIRARFRFIRKKELCAILGVSRATLERYVAEGIFPKPRKLGKRIVGWRSDELEPVLIALPTVENAYSCRAPKEATNE